MRMHALLMAATLVGLAAGTLAAQRISVSQQGKSFAPSELSISRGDTVAVINDDQVLHHVYVESPAFNFDSGERAPGQTASITFGVRGSFDVLCAIHPKMRLQVKVL